MHKVWELTILNFPHSLLSPQNQEASNRQGNPAADDSRAQSSPSARGPGTGTRGPGSGTQTHASVGAHHAVTTKGHWARHYLCRIRRHHTWHVHPPHDHSEQAGRPASHLCGQMGQSSARYDLVCLQKVLWKITEHTKNLYFALYRLPEPSPGRSDDPPAKFLAVPHVFWTRLEIIPAV